jgi:hypothetical protein
VPALQVFEDDATLPRKNVVIEFMKKLASRICEPAEAELLNREIQTYFDLSVDDDMQAEVSIHILTPTMTLFPHFSMPTSAAFSGPNIRHIYIPSSFS